MYLSMGVHEDLGEDLGDPPQLLQGQSVTRLQVPLHPHQPLLAVLPVRAGAACDEVADTLQQSHSLVSTHSVRSNIGIFITIKLH